MAEVVVRDQARHHVDGRRLVPRPRERQGRGPAGQLRRQPRHHRRRAARRDLDAGGGHPVVPDLRGHLPRGRVPARPAPHPGALLGPRLRPGEGRQPAGRAVARQAVDVHHHPRRRGAAVPPRQGRRQRRPADAEGLLPVAHPVKPGEIFNRSKLSDDLQKLTDYYKDRGYAYVNASPSTPVDEKTRIVDVIFEIQKGELVTFNRINIRGNTKTRDKVIRRELRIYEGDSYNQTLLDYSKKRVNALGFFEKVEMSTKRGRHRRQDGRQLRGHRAADRHVPDRRRLLVGRELHRPGAGVAEQPVRPRPAAGRCRRSSRACASCS